MFATIVGGVLALIFLGLPLAIIGLFVQSLLERRNARPPEVADTSPAAAESEAAPSQHKRSPAGHRAALAAPIAARHHDARGSARDHGRGERRGTIPERHSMMSASPPAADRAASASARDRRA